ncbi:Bifunctional protein PutA [Tritonibacter multivorans]|uniref:Bifunctional protein PutA n=1 Tax=Tritonibacter multivorans TaxID=928856 RepID=A0A0P1G524_9RHOB|nr:bifunctional proline dehydrogenase/L-glutamate gamma-semialdehyde dehydrogenase PutA [Tritonibacter multivorans]MDA7421801.1 bifunctional proline dehydrogenase/L-glutamate gamma-semialdehyde dehydrogenase PutA [Tritonibacter multivorans]CUH76851.1 Bifunctional protein PutA [Tritonibacter multivorans]SFD05919.1 L-proline dehydrogenase /delta-1-pyrroline-5-carboxylate dehydrogenase [Tritonibacter multivorans]
MTQLQETRSLIRAAHLRSETQAVQALIESAALSKEQRSRMRGEAVALVNGIRTEARPSLMDVFLAEYGLSTDEGVALMCLAEALLRVPDAETVDALIEDKIAPSEWGKHLGQSSSSLVNASTWALLLTGKVLNDDQPGFAGILRGALKRLGEPVIRTAVSRAMKEMGAQFVLGQTIDEALKRGSAQVAEGYTYSYDMLGEAALTQGDADTFFAAYADAIAKLSTECTSADIRENPGISIKLSALHPRYEVGQKARVMDELVPRTLELAQAAKAAGMGLNIDAEEADRLDLSLDVIEAVLRDPSLAGWDGFGVVVQAYGRRAADVLDWLYQLSCELDRKIMVRLVKGAYWDTEIKRAQVEGLKDFPVFTQKVATDISYIANAKKLLGMTDRIYPQFATHNAHTVAAVLELATDPERFEFQRLHGMGEALHDTVRKKHKARCRIYAPVGAHRDLLAYLVRRLLENGANSSFVNQIVDEDVPAEVVAADPFAEYDPEAINKAVLPPAALYGAERENARGWDLHDDDDLDEIEAARSPFATHQWAVTPITARAPQGDEVLPVQNPAAPSDTVGTVTLADAATVEAALRDAAPWDAPAEDRRAVLFRAADLYEQNFGEIFAVLTREAGKTPMDAIAELREAVDFLRYYGARAPELEQPARGLFTCISPWNFPLAIFTGQIAAALAAGNGVLAKPAETTAVNAAIGVRLLLEAGVPATALQLLPGPGSVVGAALTSDARVSGVCFTGSTATAQRINRTMAETLPPSAPLIAETGGLNAMIVDSTALPEQAVKDIVASAFQSAGQRCSALRCLYVQEDVADTYLKMLFGAMDELVVGQPWQMSTDVGPVINEAARSDIQDYIEAARAQGRVLKELARPTTGTFVAPTVIRVNGIEDMRREIFGPVLHVATYKARELDQVVDTINASGFGLTFGMHSRIDDRIQQVTERLTVGNMYINRNQIGAIVGSQPFGGEGLSGTGPKAGGPAYVKRFTQAPATPYAASDVATLRFEEAQALLNHTPQPDRVILSETALPGPTGESNVLATYGRGVVLCLGPTAEAAQAQAKIAEANGCRAALIAPGAVGAHALDGTLDLADLGRLTGFQGVALWAEDTALRTARRALAGREGQLLPLWAEQDLADRCVLERHTCIDTTAAGGNASLLADAS